MMHSLLPNHNIINVVRFRLRASVIIVQAMDNIDRHRGCCLFRTTPSTDNGDDIVTDIKI